jgi:TRAP-type mannitol/chloroaromatic compound transport system substrate-binding protein
MKRRQFLGTVATGAVAAAALTGCSGSNEAKTEGAPAILTKKRSLRLVTAWPKNFPGFGVSAERFAERVGVITEGQIAIKVLAAGEFVGAFESFDAVSLGNADMYHAADYYFQGKHKALNFFTAVPFGFTADEMASWIHYGGGQELWDEVSGKFNIKPMIVANSGTQMAGWYKKEINTLEDFKGLRIRWPGLGGEVIRRLGAAVNALPGGDIFQALQSGAIDAAEWIGPWNDMALGFHRIAPYYYYPGFHEPGSSITLGINKDLWQDLTPVQQEIITAVSESEYNRSLAEYNFRNGEFLRTLETEQKITPRPLSNEILMEIGRISNEVMKEIGAGDELSGRVYKSYLEFRKLSIEMRRVGETAFLDARKLDFPYGT